MSHQRPSDRLAPKRKPFPTPLRHPIGLPPADPWDQQHGIQPVAEFQVMCTWVPLTEDWATAQPSIMLDGKEYALCRQADIRRVYRQVGGETVESPELMALAWTKKWLASGGVTVLEVGESNPGHEDFGKGRTKFKWIATVGSRLSVAVVEIEQATGVPSHARLVPVE